MECAFFSGINFSTFHIFEHLYVYRMLCYLCGYTERKNIFMNFCAKFCLKCRSPRQRDIFGGNGGISVRRDDYSLQSRAQCSFRSRALYSLRSRAQCRLRLRVQRISVFTKQSAACPHGKAVKGARAEHNVPSRHSREKCPFASANSTKNFKIPQISFSFI